MSSDGLSSLRFSLLCDFRPPGANATTSTAIEYCEPGYRVVSTSGSPAGYLQGSFECVPCHPELTEQQRERYLAECGEFFVSSTACNGLCFEPAPTPGPTPALTPGPTPAPSTTPAPSAPTPSPTPIPWAPTPAPTPAPSSPPASAYAAEHAALEALFAALDGYSWKKNSLWMDLNGGSHCDWHGVSCTASDTVQSLSLPSNNLRGSLSSSSFSAFSALTSLNLASNPNLSPPPPGTFPPTLTTLILNDCNLSLSLQSHFASLPSLRTLLVQNNRLAGSVSAWSPPPSLEIFWAGSNLLTGSVSGLARGLPSLVQLSLPANSLTGALPAVSPRLLLLDLSSNPTLSSTLADLAPPNTNELAHLVLADAGLTGPVREDDLLPLGGLVRLRLEDNELEGSFPFSALPLSLPVFSIDNNFLLPPASPASTTIMSSYGICSPPFHGRADECVLCPASSTAACFIGQLSCSAEDYDCSSVADWQVVFDPPPAPRNAGRSVGIALLALQATLLVVVQGLLWRGRRRRRTEEGVEWVGELGGDYRESGGFEAVRMVDELDAIIEEAGSWVRED
ncbi:hypothetical protein TeGR_g1609 [Tetraparma gracilis]|uniref:L domain-like protein n=1 Tax=Tetraparma gracilis TaxID=2962635 RepID=A0ABQ6MXT9_9STRA|nr:hypothetical protein TeGR_g1609 [Tetraparma gracilis]